MYIRKNKGITLIALIITVIVMLILAGVAIGSIINNGLIDKTGQAVEAYNNSVNNENDQINNALGWFDNINNGGSNDNGGSTDGSWNGTVNTPKLASGMKAVYWAKDDSGDIDTENPANNTIEITQDDPNFKPENWYNYVAQTGTTDGQTSRWANAITDDGSYWVWIPRFAYEITKGLGTNTAGTINIKFLQGTTNKDSDGNTISTTYPTVTGDAMTDYVVEPCFTNGTANNYANGEWKAEIAGIWVAKFRASHSDATSLVIGTSTTIKIVPSIQSWTNATPGDSYTFSREYNENLESHLMKNSEWGAVAYLTHSQYGRNGTAVTANNRIMTGGNDYKSNTNQSSTGNITGIYDLSSSNGWENVASYITDGVASLSTYGWPGILTTANENPTGVSTPYATAYPYNSSSDTGTANYAATNNYKAYKNLKDSSNGTYGYGDAILETSSSANATSSWFSNYSNFPNSAGPFFTRGSIYNSGGVFGFNYATSGYIYGGFRIVLVP
ncbi:MAG: hypothetical protein FWF46_06985 [Oscillospiraceae bacterium]|nr:hypothetical protein [Oscillospiraceae bacterium]